MEEIRPGDVVSIAPGEKHWHGAAPTTAMIHIAIQESLNGKVVDWMEQCVRTSNTVVSAALCAARLRIAKGDGSLGNPG